MLDMLKYFRADQVDGKVKMCAQPAYFFALQIEMTRFTKECLSCPQWQDPISEKIKEELNK